nr:hypothetical protein [Tanacetum cinerariifolium]
ERHEEKESPKTEKSSIKTSIIFSIISWKMAIMHLWNVPGVLHKPKGIRSDFILKEIKTFLQTPNELSNLDDDYYDAKGDILYLENLLNEDPYPNLPLVKTEDLKQVDGYYDEAFD